MFERFTNEQIDAIISRNENLLVSAAAGSGKTSVLIERIAGLITGYNSEPVDIDRLLVVTFTKAAAGEMKDRLRRKLTELIKKGDKNPLYQRQLALINRANISTFDSLCQAIVRENFMSLDIDPSFKIGNDVELSILKQNAMDEIFEELYQLNDDFIALADTFCEKADDTPLKIIVSELYDFIQTERDPLAWLIKMPESYNVSSITDTFYADTAFRFAKTRATAALDIIKSAIAIADSPDGPAHYLDTLLSDYSHLDFLCQSDSYMSMAEAFTYVKFNNLSSKRPKCDDALKEEAKALRNEAKSIIEEIGSSYFFTSTEKMARDMTGCYKLLKMLAETAYLFSSRYMEFKKEKRILSFSDIKLLCYKVLVSGGQFTDAAIKLRKQFSYVMVDEYQDTNDVEEGILDALSGNADGVNNRFMVGDVKQSIYRFRQSNPALFTQKADEYTKDGKTSRLISLHKNFRSRASILNGINFIFSQIMTKKAAEIEYDSSAALVPGAGYSAIQDDCIDIYLIETDKADDESTDGSNNSALKTNNGLSALEVEAAVIADTIYDMVYVKKLQIEESGKKRPMKFKDIAILMRSGKQKGSIVSDVLSAKGIPSFTEGKAGYFELTEISDIFALLQIIDNPLQDIPLMTVLLSPIYKFTADELYAIRKDNNTLYFYDALTEYTRNNDDDISKKAKGFLHKLYIYRNKAASMPVSRLLMFLYDDTGYILSAGTMENGELRQANLRSLITKAADFESATLVSLFHFVRYLEKLKQSNSLGASNAVNDDADLVKIMTIHKSKGLEFPVVFVASCGSRFNTRDLNDKIILHQQLGCGAVYLDHIKRTKADTLARNVVRQTIKNEFLAEEIRLLYVAMTRAKEKLIITGRLGADTTKALSKWRLKADSNKRTLTDYSILSSSCYLDFIMPAVLRSESSYKFISEYGVEPIYYTNDYSKAAKFDMCIYKRSDVQIAQKSKESLSKEHLFKKIAVSSYEDQIDIDKLLNWKYNYVNDINTPVKISISEIKTRYQKIISGDIGTVGDTDDLIFKAPVFMHEKKGLTAAEKGTALHAVMANLDVKQVKCYNDIIELMDTLLKSNIIDKDEYDSVNPHDIETFLNSDIVKRMILSDNIKRETPFVVGLTPLEAFLPNSGDIVLVHGIVDCYFEENGNIIILDYKTDYAFDGIVSRIAEKYKIQMEVYKKAIRQITQKPVTESYLYMMRHGLYLEV